MIHLQAVLPGTVSGLLGFEGILGDVVGGLVSALFVASIMFIITALAGPWVKRRITAVFADRIAIDRTGPLGLLAIVTDAVRLLSKELVVPEDVDRPAWDLAPVIIPFSALLGFAVIPMGNDIQPTDSKTGLASAFVAVPIALLGIVMTGYASSNKFSFIGVLRTVAVNIAHETPLVVTAASVAVLAGSLRVSEIVVVQAKPLFSVVGVTTLTWFVSVNPFAFTLFVITNLAEVGRNPFDIPEASTEIVTGCQTEYSSVYFVFIYLSEFIHIFFGGVVAATLFLDGLADPVLLRLIQFATKIWAFFLSTQWARSTVPHLRVDQFPEIGWKGMLMPSFANLVLAVIIVEVTA